MNDPALTSSWCTAWGSYNTPRLWAMVKDEDDPEAWRQVAAWGAISGAVKDQRALLVKAREALVAAWPPEQNKSSAAFVLEVDKLIARMDAAKTEADDTATGLANILEALRQAKNNIQPLWEQYKAKSDDLVPAWWDHAEDELDEQAQAHMITAEQIVQDNVVRLRVPDPYVLEPTDPHYQPTPLAGDGNPGVGAGAGGSAGGRAAGGVTVPVPHDPVPPLPGLAPTVPEGAETGGGAGSGVSSGPGLAGVSNPPVAPVNPPPGGGGPGSVPPPGPGVGPGIGPGIGSGVGGVGPVGGPGGGRPVSRAGTGRGAPGLPGSGVPGVPGSGSPGGQGTGGLGAGGVGGLGRGARPGARPESAGRRALPSGAVIGETVAGEGRGVAGRGGVGGVGGGGAGRGSAGVGGPGAGAGRVGPGVGGSGAGRGGPGVGGVGGGAGRGGPGVGGGAGRGGPGGGGDGAGVGGGAGRGGAGVGGVGGGAGRGPGARGAGQGPGNEQVRPPRPAWLPDEPVGAARREGPPGPGGQARAGRRPGDGEQQPFDPDGVWAVAEGVDPVITPGVDTARHDPGPNVIGRHG